MKNGIPQDVYGKEIAIVIILLAIIFFFVAHDLEYSQQKESIEKTIAVEENIIEGSLRKRIALLSFGLISILGLLFAKKRYHLKWGEPLGWVLLFFGAWSLASVIWSIDITVTIRRLAVFGIICLGALTMTRRFSINFVPVCVFYITTLYLAIGLSVEIVSQTFQPLSGDFRFSGTVHPNVQGINCSMMLLAAVSLAKCPNRRRIFFLFAAILAFVCLILTKSRTSLIGVLFTLAVLLILNSSKSMVFAYILGIFSIFSAFFLFMGDDLISIGMKYFFLGRYSSETITLTGRTSLWETILSYISLRPFLGYGFSSFWIPLHIQNVSYVEGWTVPDAHSVYIDILLGIGIVGLFSYLSILFLGLKKALSICKKNRVTGYQFLFLIMVFFSINGLVESAIIQFSSLESFVFIWGLLYLAFLDPMQKELYEHNSFQDILRG